MNTPSLCVKELTVDYGARRVLSGVSFEVYGGSLVALLGRNGSGKSTLFRCILGLLSYRGRIAAGGRDTRGMSASERASAFAYIPQGHENASSHTALEMVLMGASSRLGFWSTPGRREAHRAVEAMEEIGIGHLSDRRYDRLSGGEKQLVLTARALAQDASILIMDEPCSNLDYGHQLRVLDCAAGLARRGYLVVLSTHNPEHALSFADQALLLMDGAVNISGEPSDVMDAATLERMYGVPLDLAPAGGMLRTRRMGKVS
ncbi:MAG: ABC transporter ATP-binding protein [Synergistota bacterium]|jgi:iron complex transport system ATP-binding protein|nr:ABC transporter ATP-binding protein [Synergistota bacterium]